MENQSEIATKLTVLFRGVEQHLGGRATNYMIIDYITDAVAERIKHESQEEPQERICPHCNGSCEEFDAMSGESRQCEECEGYGIIKE